MGKVTVGEELSSCPKCKGGGGFHVAFRRLHGERERKLEITLVCPHCGFRFSVGEFVIPSGEPRPYDPSIDSVP